MNPDPAGSSPTPPPPLPPPLPPAGGAPFSVQPAGSQTRRTGLIVAIVAIFLLVAGGTAIFAFIKLKPRLQTALEGVKSPEQRRRERELFGKIEEAKRRAIAEQRRAIDEPDGDSITGTTERVDRVRGLLGEMSQQSKGEERLMMEIVGRYLADLQKKTQAYEAAVNALKQAGFFAPETLTTPEAIATRRTLTRQWLATNEDFAEFIRTTERRILAEAEKVIPSRDQARKLASSFARNANTDLLLRIRDYDRQVANSGLEELDLLQDNWGQWKVEPDGAIGFDRPATLAQFNKIQEAMAEAGEAQRTLQRQALDAQSRAATAPGRASARPATPGNVVPPRPSPAASPAPGNSPAER